MRRGGVTEIPSQEQCVRSSVPNGLIRRQNIRFLYHTPEEHLPSHDLYGHNVHQTHRACAISAAVRPGLIFSVGHIFHMAGSLAITRIQTFHLLLGQRQLIHKREETQTDKKQV